MSRHALAAIVFAAAACGGAPADDSASEDDLSKNAAPDIVVYSQDGWNELADAFAAGGSGNATFFMHIPAPAEDKTWPRGPVEPAKMRARGSQFRALAEFHWGAWRDAPGTWYDKGVEFRRRMAAKGYDVAAGDAWAINELPSTARRDPAVRQNAREAIRGLYDGPAGSPKVRGAVFIAGVGSGTVNFSDYKPHLEAWLSDADFWKAMSPRVRFWGQETYTDPATACVPGVVVARRSDAIDGFIEHVPRLAAAGGSRTAAARSFLARTYTPLLNGAFRSAAYQTDGVTLDQMKHFVSNQLYAARAWGSKHGYAAGRVGLGWNWSRDQVTRAELDDLAQRVASAARYAWDDDGGAAAGACSPSRAYTFCQCALPGAAFNGAWGTFDTW